MPEAADHAERYSALIYVCGTESATLEEAERRCLDYAARFRWAITGTIHTHEIPANPGFLLSKAHELGAQIIVTDTLDMLSPDPATRDSLMMDIERAQYILHPLTTQPTLGASSGASRE